MLRNLHRHAPALERRLAIGARCRFPVGQLGDRETYGHSWEVASFTPDGRVTVRRLADGLEKTIAARWALEYLHDEVSSLPPPAERPVRRAFPAPLPHERGLDFFASVRDPGDPQTFAIVLGPFPTECEARANVATAREVAAKLDRRAPWYAFGICSAPRGEIRADHVLLSRSGRAS